MAATHNYYRILGIKTTAGVQEIRQAIHALREKDTAGNYTATLNAIEETLSDPEKRGAYDDQLGVDPALRGDYYVSFQIKGEEKPNTSFVDVTGKEYGSEQALRNAQKARYNQMTVELEEWEKSIATRTRILSMGRMLVFLSMLVVAVLFGLLSGKPFYDDYQAKKQAEAAYVELTKAGKSVMDYIRAQKTYPSNVPTYAREGDYYDVSILSDDSFEQNFALNLKFTGNARSELRDGNIIFELYRIPNGILDWRCQAKIPAQYIPARCPIN